MRDDLHLYLGRQRGGVYVDKALMERHPSAYAVTIEGDCLAPAFNDGDIVLVDPDKNATPGAFVVLGKKGWPPHAAMMLEPGDAPQVRDGHATYRVYGEEVLGVIVGAIQPVSIEVVE